MNKVRTFKTFSAKMEPTQGEPMQPTWKRLFHLLLKEASKSHEVESLLLNTEKMATILAQAALSDDPESDEALDVLYKHMSELADTDWNERHLAQNVGVSIRHILYEGKADAVSRIVEKHVKRLRLKPQTDYGRSALYQMTQEILESDLLPIEEKYDIFLKATESFAKACRMDSLNIRKWAVDVIIHDFNHDFEDAVDIFLEDPNMLSQVYWSTVSSGSGEPMDIILEDCKKRRLQDVLDGHVLGLYIDSSIRDHSLKGWMAMDEMEELLNLKKFAWKDPLLDKDFLAKIAVFFDEKSDVDALENQESYPSVYHHVAKFKMEEELLPGKPKRKTPAL